MIRISACLVVCLLAAFGVPAVAADCGAVEGSYAINLSGFGGGAPVYFPVALIGNITVEKNGDVAGNYKIHAPISGGLHANRNITGKLTVNATSCVGTLQVRDANRNLIHTMTVIQTKDGSLAVALGETGLVASGTARK